MKPSLYKRCMEERQDILIVPKSKDFLSRKLILKILFFEEFFNGSSIAQPNYRNKERNETFDGLAYVFC